MRSTRSLVAGACCAALFLASACGGGHSDHDDHMHPHDHGDLGPTETLPYTPATPYGPGWEQLEGKSPEAVATNVLEYIVKATPAQSPTQIVESLNGVLTTEALGALNAQPGLVDATPIMPVLEQWQAAGGGITVHTEVSAEQHPADTETSWARKMQTTRELEGIDEALVDVWMVELSRDHDRDNWRLNRIARLDTSYSTEQ